MELNFHETISKTLTTAFFIAFIVSTLSAQNNTSEKGSKTIIPSATANRGQFVDNNENGICDNFEARVQGGKVSNFVDKNGDGICDNRGMIGRGNGRGNG
jgi:hypothetical protein